MSAPALSPSVEIVDHHPVTSSRKVAEYFGKNHRDVLRSIQNLPCSPEFNERNFAPVEYADSKGEKRPEYLLTKNGFVFLVMGFTGAKAAKLKESYIAEFDRMEAEIRRIELSGGNPRALPEEQFISPIHRSILREIVYGRVHQVPFDLRDSLRARIWDQFEHHFRISNIEGLPDHLFDAARSFLETVPLDVSALSSPVRERRRPEILPASLDTPLPEAFRTQKLNYELIGALRARGKSPLDSLLKKLEAGGVDTEGAQAELALIREILSTWWSVFESIDLLEWSQGRNMAVTKERLSSRVPELRRRL